MAEMKYFFFLFWGPKPMRNNLEILRMSVVVEMRKGCIGDYNKARFGADCRNGFTLIFRVSSKSVQVLWSYKLNREPLRGRPK